MTTSFIPNTFPFPTEYVTHLSRLADGEVRILLYLWRCRYGYRALPAAWAVPDIALALDLDPALVYTAVERLHAAGYLLTAPGVDGLPLFLAPGPAEDPDVGTFTIPRYSRLTLAVGARDGWQCHYCRRALLRPEELAIGPGGSLITPATLDHKQPRAAGGTNDLGNLLLACSSCNSIKGARSYEWALVRLREDEL